MNIRTLFFTAFRHGVVKHKGFRPGRKDDELGSFKAALDARLKARDAELQRLIEKAQGEVDAGGKMSLELKEEIEKHVKTSAELQERLTGLEQELAAFKAAGTHQAQAAKSAGARFVEDEGFKALVAKGRGSALMRLKSVANITSLTTGTGGVGAGIVPDRLPGILMPALRQFTIRDLILPGRTSSNLIQYVQESGFQNMTAPVAEGASKPQSDLSFELLDSSVKTLAHWVRASNQILADIPQLETYIDTRLTYGLKYVEEAQLLSGDGTGQNLLGLIPQATAFDTTKTKPGDTKIDTIRRAILQVRVAEYRASAIVLNPVDWADIEMQKDEVGRYLWVNVATGAEPQLWRLPVVDSSAMPAGQFMVGAFNMAAQVFDREDANVQVSTEDADNFTKNMVTIRAEERLALVVFRPESFVHGTFPQDGTIPTT
ncbi:MAG TPA: phage major capsid protein [Burkholderiales bacterium]